MLDAHAAHRNAGRLADEDVPGERVGHTAAAKVNALAHNGMDEIDVRAFLRKQAD